jgi:hypothetical protein
MQPSQRLRVPSQELESELPPGPQERPSETGYCTRRATPFARVEVSLGPVDIPRPNAGPLIFWSVITLLVVVLAAAGMVLIG